MEKVVWIFTNKRELNRSQFINYFERKVFRTIRKYSMLPENKVIKMKKIDTLNYNVLKIIIEKKFKVEESKIPNILHENLSEVAEVIFKNIIGGNFSGPKPDMRPLYFLSDKEVELYARLMKIPGKSRNQDKKIQGLFEKFLKKNQDLELNIVKALSQLRN